MFVFEQYFCGTTITQNYPEPKVAGKHQHTVFKVVRGPH